jgi:excisionase family DNA binding protein
MSHKTFLTTGQAAKLCSVTPDTVLKWIKQGLIPAHRTAGGHYRIRRQDIRQLEVHPRPANQESPERRRSFQYCWEYNASEESPLPACKECVVFRTRAYRCYEVIKLDSEIGHSRKFCTVSCEECDYFQRVHLQDTNVLVISDNQVMAASLNREGEGAALNLQVADCEYTCSTMVEGFRPDYAIIDCSLGLERSRDFVKHLKEDPRIPYLRVILAAQKEEFPQDCDREVFARIESPFDLKDIVECIRGVRGKGDEVEGRGETTKERRATGKSDR